MKDIICILDEDNSYTKKFSNTATKIYGKEYVFLSFTDIKNLIEYTQNNNVTSIITNMNYEEETKNIKSKYIYILKDVNNDTSKDGRYVYLYKYQSIIKILEVVDRDIKALYDKHKQRSELDTEIIAFYSPYEYREIIDFLIRTVKYLTKTDKSLLINLDEYSNFKSNIGLSNIIYEYKEQNLNIDSIKHEIENDKGIDIIKSVSYPDDFNVLTNIDLSNIINSIRMLDYKYIILNLDTSFVKNEYLMVEADKLLLYQFDENDKYRLDALKSYIKSQCLIDMSKLSSVFIDKSKKNYIRSFVKDYIIGS